MKRIISMIMLVILVMTSLSVFSSCNSDENQESLVPTVGENGNWWIGDTDLGVSADPKVNDDDDAQAPKFRYNTATNNFEISYDDGKTWVAIGEADSIEAQSPGISYPVASIEKLPGTIADKTNKYITAETNAGGYHGGLISLTGVNYSYVQLVRNANGNDLGYAFLKDSLVLNSEPKYATGYTHCVWDSSETVMLEIPSDAKYLYIYYNSEADIHLPASVTFFESYKNPLKSESVANYVYPLEKIEVLRGYVTSSNVFTKSTLRNGAIIEIEDTTFNTVTLKKNAEGGNITYAFMSDEFYDGFTPCYAAGYTNVVTVSDDSVTLQIPDNARYLYVYYKNGSNILLPSEIKFTKQTYAPANSNSVRIATWNIGHFAMGNKSNSTIEDTQVAMKSADFLDYINNAVDADIMFLNEYSQKFTKNNYLAKNTIFSSYNKIVYEGPQRKYSCNAVYSRIEISQPEIHEFECNKTAGYISPHVESTDYYFVTTDLVINGKTVKLISVHLAFDGEGSENVVINQLNELIAYCEQFEHVVMLGDWNVNTFSEFNVFTEAGYTLANTDKNMPTYMSGSSLDNIVYKGVKVTDFTLAGTNLSDHYALYCTITVEDN